MKYTTKTIDELCEKITDGAHNSPEECIDGPYPMYSSKDMLYGGFSDSDVKRISDQDYKKLVAQDCQPKKNDILIIKDGANYLKYAFKIPERLDAVILSSIAILRPNTRIIDPDYFTYLLRTDSIRRAMSNFVSGAAIPRIVLKDFKRMKLRFVIDINCQREIANILISYDNLIEVNNKRIRLLEQMAENLYKEWFVRFRFPGYKSAEFENGIPKGWEYTRFAEVYNYDRGVSYTTEEIECVEGENLINLKNIQGFGGFRRDGTKLFSGQYKPEQVVKYKDLVMGVTDMTQDRRTVGAVALIPNIRGVISADLIKLSSKINNVFSYCMFRWGFYSKYVSQFGNGANVIHLKPSTIANKKFLIPAEKIITAFTKLVDPIVDHIESLYAENKNLIKQRDLLLPRLMSGKLEV